MKIGSVKVAVIDDGTLEEYGAFESGAQGYVIRLNVPESLRATTLVHEVLHAISDLYGLEFSESTIRVLEQALVCWMIDNPETARSLVNGLAR